MPSFAPHRNIVTGIDIGTHAVRAVVAEWDEGAAMPEILGIGIAESRGLRHGYIVNREEAARSIAAAVGKAEKASGFRVRHAFLSSGGVGLEGFTGYGAAMVSRADGEVSAEDMEKAIAASEATVPGIQNKKVIYLIPLGYRVDGRDVLGRPEGMRGVKIEVRALFVTCLSAHINEIIGAAEDAGIEVDDIFPSPVAASAVTLTREQKTAGCVLANIGAETVSIAVFENNIPVSLKVFPIGSTDITNDIALGFRVSLEEAEGIKVGRIVDPRYSRRRTDDIVAARLSDIFELVDAHLKKIDRSGLLPAGIVLTGGGAQISSLAEIAKNTLKIPSRIGFPAFGSSSASLSSASQNSLSKRNQKTLSGREREEERNQRNPFVEIKNIPSWTVAYGLCIMGFFAEKEPTGWKKKMKEIFRSTADFFKQFLP